MLTLTEFKHGECELCEKDGKEIFEVSYKNGMSAWSCLTCAIEKFKKKIVTQRAVKAKAKADNEAANKAKEGSSGTQKS